MSPVSVIIPTFQDDEALGRLVQQLLTMQVSEIIICDAEDRSDLPAHIKSQTKKIRHVKCPVGRGPQIKSGLDVAEHDFVWVLHADSLPHHASINVIQTELTGTQNSLVTFTLTFDKPHLLLSVYTWFSRWDSAVSTFGDQGYAFRLSDYNKLALDLSHYPLMEDVALRNALKQHGKVKRSPLKITTSSRRFQKYGILRTQTMNLLILIRFALGASPTALYAKYYGQNV